MSITSTAPTAVTGMPLDSKALISIAAMAAGRGRISAAKVFRRPEGGFVTATGVKNLPVPARIIRLEIGISRSDIMRVRDMNGYHKTDRALLRRLSADSRLSGAEYRVLISAMLAEKEPGDLVELGNIVTGHDTMQAARTVERAKKTLLKFGYLQEAGKGHRSATLFKVTTTDEMTGGQMTGGQMTGGTTDEMTGGRQTRTLILETGNDLPSVPLTEEPAGAEHLPITDTKNPEAKTVHDAANESKPETTPAPPKEPTPPPKKAGKTAKAKKSSELTPHPVFLEWNKERIASGLPTSKIGPQNNVFAAKLGELVSEPELRRKVLQAFFARKNDNWLVEEGFVFYQLVNHRLDQCIAIASKGGTAASSQGNLDNLADRVNAVAAKYGDGIGRQYDAKARELKSTSAADTWLDGVEKREGVA